jgi:hypothetical protein
MKQAVPARLDGFVIGNCRRISVASFVTEGQLPLISWFRERRSRDATKAQEQ